MPSYCTNVDAILVLSKGCCEDMKEKECFAMREVYSDKCTDLKVCENRKFSGGNI